MKTKISSKIFFHKQFTRDIKASRDKSNKGELQTACNKKRYSTYYL